MKTFDFCENMTLIAQKSGTRKGTFRAMGQVLAHVLTDKKAGRLSCRRPYPPELLPFLDVPPDRSEPPKELKRSLKAAFLAEGDALDILAGGKCRMGGESALARWMMAQSDPRYSCGDKS